jgi:hypothetical protein
MADSTFGKIASRRPFGFMDLLLLPTMFKASSTMLGMVPEMIDQDRGVGVVDDESGLTRCVWLTDGRRITFSAKDGNVVFIIPKDADPFIPEPFADDPAEPVAKQAAS